MDVADGTPPSEVQAIIDSINTPTSPDNQTVTASVQFPEEVENALETASFIEHHTDILRTSADEQYQNALDAELNELASNCATGGDPVQLAVGQFVTESEDLYFRHFGESIQVKRDYQSNSIHSGSMGNRRFSYDTRIILGIKNNARAISEQAYTENSEANGIYIEQLNKYRAFFDVYNFR